MRHIHCAGLIAVKNRKLLLAFSKNKQAYYLPGGKVDADETAVKALKREVKEELNIILHENDLQFYCHITAPAFGEANGLIMEQDCFMCELKEAPKPTAEILKVEYFDEATYKEQEHLVPGVMVAFEQLRKDKFID